MSTVQKMNLSRGNDRACFLQTGIEAQAVTRKVSIRIANISIGLVVDEGFSREVESAYRHFISNKPAEYSLRVSLVNDISKKPSDNREVFIQGDRLMIISDEFTGHMDLRKKTGQVDILPNWALGSLASFLKNLCSVLILSEGGLMLHAAGVVRDNRAYIFFGPSGSGKSTVARLSNNYSILNDELVGVRRVNGSFNACGTPDLEMGISGFFKIRGLFKLIKDSEVYLKRFSYHQAIAEIFTVPQFYNDFLSVEKILDCCLDLAKVVPCYELHFLPDDSFWRCIDGHINQMA